MRWLGCASVAEQIYTPLRATFKLVQLNLMCLSCLLNLKGP